MLQIAIIGGGLSGACTAIHLLRSNKPCNITIYEKNKHHFLKGPAYSSVLPHQLLNVPASGMSLFEDQPDDFYNWIVQKESEVLHKPGDFVSRQLFGAYIADTFEAERATSLNSVSLVCSEVKHIEPTHGGFALTAADKKITHAHHVVLSIGNLPPQELVPAEWRAGHPRFIQNPWEGKFLESVGQADDVLLIGTGLTMVDVLLSLKRTGHNGKVCLLSRRGYLPKGHEPAPVYKLKLTSSFNHRTVFGILAWLKAEIILAKAEGANWVSVLNAMREMTPALWQNMAQIERQRFLRHLRPFWEIHRHRIPAASLQQIVEQIAEGGVEKFAGRIKDIAVRGENFIITFLSKGTAELQELSAKWIVNCTGPNTSMNRSGDTLVNDLLSSRLLHTDVTGTGLVASEQFSGIHLVGPPARGTYWECTALREIRQHAAQVADKILQSGEREHSLISP